LSFILTSLLLCAGSVRASDRPTVVALLANRQLVVVAPDGTITQPPLRLGPAEPPAELVGNYLALSRDRRTVFALVPGSGGAQRLVSISSATFTLVRTYPLPSRIFFRSLQIGPRTGRLYLVGNRGPNAAVALALSPATGKILIRETTIRSNRRSWYVLATAISANERYLLVSYHGSDTQGADWLRIGPQFQRCKDHTPPQTACLSLHGGVAFRGANIVATTGEGPLLELTLENKIVRRWQPRLPRNHLMSFALDADRERAAVIGSCGYSGGLSLLDLVAGTTEVMGYPLRICGERVVFAGTSTVVIARNPLPVPQGRPSSLDTVDMTSGEVTQHVATPAESIDTLFLP
jgi:hypothetical protein